jgi:SAM-dependent methyltransferase
MKYDLGAGHSRKPGYIRVDADPRCFPDIEADVANLPLEDNQADEIYAAHLLEHFDPEETFTVLREWWRVLKPGGTLVIKVPDCGWAFSAWANREIRDCCLMKTIFGADPKANEFMRHKNVFWSTKLERFLFITGFVDIENKSKHGSGELHFEAKKP